MAPEDDVEVVIDETREKGDEIVNIRILSVLKSEKSPEGVKYRFQYGKKRAENPILRYDNQHGVHERHDGGSVEEIDSPGVKPLLQRFLDEAGIDL
ncbi:toxin-antitoxin system TumE family protein [Halopelagius longus]|nr:DUF6516 family protein [Halopelagius longus]RDI69593.1 hypothetical protein DWB78_18640 [Halopelagius longus]